MISFFFFLASSWAGWAVSALTSKFHRSQSSQSGLSQQAGQITGAGRTKGRYNFGNQSSSSTSTTTSSIPSTPSVDRDVLQPTAEGQESATDYEDDWDNEDWGAIEESVNKASRGIENNFAPTAATSNVKSSGGADGWDTWAIEETVRLIQNYDLLFRNVF